MSSCAVCVLAARCGMLAEASCRSAVGCVVRGVRTPAPRLARARSMSAGARPSAWPPPDAMRGRAAAAGGAVAAARAQQALPAALCGPGGARAGRPLPGPHRRALHPAAALACSCCQTAWDPPRPCAWAARAKCSAFGLWWTASVEFDAEALAGRCFCVQAARCGE